jgi:hypothetical protein
MKVILSFILILTLSACASRRKTEEAQAPIPTATPAPPKPQIKYVYIDRTLPTTSAMTIAPLDVPPAKEIDIMGDVARILWPLLALLGAGAVMIAGLYAEHLIINRQLAARRVRQSS